MPIQVQELIPHVCDVCRLIDQDLSLKPCGYCGLCDAYICKEDTDWKNFRVASRRIRAFYRRKLEPDFKGNPDYDKLAVSKEELDRINQEGNTN